MAGASDDASRLRSLLEIAKVVGATRRSDDLVEATAEAARRALDAAALSISRWDRETGLLRTLVNVGVLSPDETRFPDDETYSLAEWPELGVLVEGRTSFVSSVDDATMQAGLLERTGRDSSVSVPILVEARVWGELWGARVAGQPRYADADLDFAEAVAVQLGAGVVQADNLARVESLAFTDPLTGLANRRAVDERLELALAEDMVARGAVSIVLADINRLKQVNDTFGHEAGDRLIVSVAEAVSRASGRVKGSLAARIGGDEFCVVICDEPLSTAVEVAEELCRLVEAHPVSTGISCGVASTEVLVTPIDSPVRLLRLADAAQYRAKRAGSRHPVVAGRTTSERPSEPGSEDRRLRRGRLSTDIHGALESGLALLDAMPGADARARLEQVAEHVRDLLDAAAWWLSSVEPGQDSLVLVNTSLQRPAEPSPARPRVPGAPDLVFDLADYPSTRRAIEEAGSFFVEVGMPGNDPAEEALLVSAGYPAVLAAGATDPCAGWFVELYADPISLPMAGFESVLRALVAVAVAGARAGAAEPLRSAAEPLRSVSRGVPQARPARSATDPSVAGRAER